MPWSDCFPKSKLAVALRGRELIEDPNLDDSEGSDR